MENYVLQFLIPATGLVSGLIGAYVGLQNRALLAEVRREVAEMENRVILRLNGTYERHSEAVLRDARVHGRIDDLAAEYRAHASRDGA